MEGNPAGVFTCTASTHGGQQTTLVTMVTLPHLGTLIVGVPYSVEGMLQTRKPAPHQLLQLPEDRASWSQDRRTSSLLS